MQYGHGISHVCCSAYYGVNAHVAHSTYDYDFLHISGFQLLSQISFPKGVNVSFYDYRLVTLRGYVWLNFRTSRSFCKDRSVFSRLMPYVKNRKTGTARVADYPDSILYSSVNAGQRQIAGR
ncbi:hypothetical protein ALP39_200182 [Pseudomonas marginalis pv. marginalis]|nr:hypothetical protein ALP39_200182 [Pseudomonas marginalis pv. marginalis]